MRRCSNRTRPRAHAPFHPAPARCRRKARPAARAAPVPSHPPRNRHSPNRRPCGSGAGRPWPTPAKEWRRWSGRAPRTQPESTIHPRRSSSAELSATLLPGSGLTLPILLCHARTSCLSFCLLICSLWAVLLGLQLIDLGFVRNHCQGGAQRIALVCRRSPDAASRPVPPLSFGVIFHQIALIAIRRAPSSSWSASGSSPPHAAPRRRSGTD